jgi:hypothetical protein
MILRQEIENNSEIMSMINNEQQPYEVKIAQNCYYGIYEDTFPISENEFIMGKERFYPSEWLLIRQKIRLLKTKQLSPYKKAKLSRLSKAPLSEV